MYIGQTLLIRHNGQIKEGKVKKIFPEDLELELENGTILMRKFWEVRKKDYE